MHAESISCPLASVTVLQQKEKGKKRAAEEAGSRGGLHECDLMRAKNLTCGEHPCEKRDHMKR
jgi:transcriptional repressor NF-X1